jgi:hypothetical protein
MLIQDAYGVNRQIKTAALFSVSPCQENIPHAHALARIPFRERPGAVGESICELSLTASCTSLEAENVFATGA